VLQPVNRYILIEIPQPEESEESLIVLPEDYKPIDKKFIEVCFVKAAEDVRFTIKHPASMIVDRSMIEEISLGGTIYNVILDNYVVGIIE